MYEGVVCIVCDDICGLYGVCVCVSGELPCVLSELVIM